MYIDTNLRVLVVDDFSTMRAVVVKLLYELGFTDIAEAADGIEAWNKIQTDDFDLIVCDWNMPGMSGLDLLKEIRNSDDLKHLRFILITAEAKTNNIKDAQSLDVDGYILKPFSAETLYKKIFEIFNK